MSRLIRLACAVTLSLFGLAHAGVIDTPGPWVLSRSSSVGTSARAAEYPTEAACVAGAAAAGPGQYTCSTVSQVAVVADAATGTVTLRWTAPMFMADGMTPAALTGFRIRWGSTSKAYTGSQVVGPGATNLLLRVPAGLTYFACWALGPDGSESADGYEISKVVVAD